MRKRKKRNSCQQIPSESRIVVVTLINPVYFLIVRVMRGEAPALPGKQQGDVTA